MNIQNCLKNFCFLHLFTFNIISAKYEMFIHYSNMNIFKVPNPNLIVNVNSNVSNSARLPLSVVAGTVAKRTQRASEYSEQLKQYLDKISIGKQCTVQGFKDAINSILGKDKINLEVLPLDSPLYKGSIQRNIDVKSQKYNIGNIVFENVDANINGYKIFLPLSENNKVIDNKYVALHEGRHLFDYICHPKSINLRINKFLYEDEKTDTFNKIYTSFTQDYQPFLPHSEFKKNIRKELKKLTDEEAIEALQASRHTIASERNAYKDEINYMKKKPFSNIKSTFSCFDFLMAMRYDKKYQFASELLKEKLKVSRELIQEKNAQAKAQKKG